MATVSAPLNVEPALPEDRATQPLPPKSYAEAVEKEAPAEAINGVHGIKDPNGKTAANGTDNVGGDDTEGGHKASALSIDTGAPAAEEKEEESKEDRPQLERQESKHEYSATVLPMRFPFISAITHLR
jgi:2-acylglycerol O-acyltransferase 2